MPGFSLAVVANFGLGVGDRGLDLLRDRLGSSLDEDRALRRVVRLRHLLRRVLQVHDPRADCGNVAFGTTNVSPKLVVEPDRDVAGELDVLALVVADGDLLGVVQQDVGGHQHRVVEQADADELLALPTSP